VPPDVQPLTAGDLPADPAELADLALRTAVAAADMVRAERRAGFGVETKSTDTDMVTSLDKASDVLIRRLLLDARPDDGLLTEEDAEHAGSTGIVWIVDPIDGTTNFVYGHPPYAVSIGAAVGGRPIAGAIVEISADDRYHAWLGGGSHRNGAQLRLGEPPALAQALISTGFAYDPRRREAQAAVVARIVGQVRDIRRLGAAAYDLCSVAVGRIDGYYEHGLNAWDLAAGEIIAAEAGAAVEHLRGGPALPLDGIIAAHPALVGPLRDLLLAHGAGDL
jgi:myo-inositol-1(or 4)-monophosphatase